MIGAGFGAIIARGNPAWILFEAAGFGAVGLVTGAADAALHPHLTLVYVATRP
jgi:hypothetical protein